jgi:PAS domain S-box-containing protein
MNKHNIDLISITDNISDYIVVIDKNYTVTFANEAADALFIHNSNDVIGKKCYELSIDSSLPCHKKDSSFDCLFDKVIRTAKATSATHTYSLTDGTQKIYEISASPIKNRDGEVLQVIEVIRDITARKDAEKAILDHQSFLSSVLEGIGDGVVVLNSNFEILSANKGYLNQLGKNIEDVIGQNCYSLFHNLNKPCYLAGEDCAVKRSFLTGKPGSSTHKHGGNGSGPIYVETKSYPMKDKSGKVTKVIEVVCDITEKYLLEEELNRRVKELEEFYDMAVERELKMVELKKNIESLKKKPDKSAI